MVALAAASVALLAGCAGGTPTTTRADGWAAGGPPPAGEAATVAAFYGDSYTRGTGASDLSLRWSTLVSADRGWAEFNPSVDGLGFVNNRDLRPPGDDLVERIVGLEPEPDVVLVTMGLNDNFSMPDRADDIRSAIRRDLDRLRDELPDARIVVVEPFWYTDERPPSVDVIIALVAEAAADIDADRIDGASRWLEGHPEWMASDGLHPNDEGYAEIARRMDGELQALGL
ncbi:SGNH/GDSL hydrolase family protein [Agromyces arachidis]|uniref:SGNH/GDSL hydrolase family protein n=1 Tax=Agromyces arachidis TaxID=766966 RepID=UPI0040563B7A